MGGYAPGGVDVQIWCGYRRSSAMGAIHWYCYDNWMELAKSIFQTHGIDKTALTRG